MRASDRSPHSGSRASACLLPRSERLRLDHGSIKRSSVQPERAPSPHQTTEQERQLPQRSKGHHPVSRHVLRLFLPPRTTDSCSARRLRSWGVPKSSRPSQGQQGPKLSTHRSVPSVLRRLTYDGCGPKQDRRSLRCWRFDQRRERVHLRPSWLLACTSSARSVVVIRAHGDGHAALKFSRGQVALQLAAVSRT